MKIWQVPVQFSQGLAHVACSSALYIDILFITLMIVPAPVILYDTPMMVSVEAEHELACKILDCIKPANLPFCLTAHTQSREADEGSDKTLDLKSKIAC